MHVSLGAFVALAFLAAGSASAADDLLARAVGSFESGDYRQAARFADASIATSLAGPARIEADRISGISHFYLDEHDMARVRLLEMFILDRGAFVDARSVAPEAMRFVSTVQIESRLLTMAVERVASRSGAGSVRAVAETKARPPWFFWLPMGAGEFSEGRAGFGASFAFCQLAATLLGVYASSRYGAQPQGASGAGVPVTQPEGWRDVALTSAGVGVLAYAVSVVDAYVHLDDRADLRLTVHDGSIKMALSF